MSDSSGEENSGRPDRSAGGAREKQPPIGPRQAKSIILFSDGTGNSSATLFKTNVWRMYEAADLGPVPEGEQPQIAYYDNGVGTSAFRPLRAIQGVFGIGLKRNVLEIYRYACRNYDPAADPLPSSGIKEGGDHIYGFGFSRGAFTMRLVIGMMADQGLVPYVDEADLEWRSAAAYREFRRNRWPRVIAVLREIGAGSREATPADWRASEAAASGVAALSKTYDSSINHRPIIRFIGVWDTVAAYGGPIAEITRAIDNWFYRLSMPNYALSPVVRCARHALALDDARDSFQPLVWDELAEVDARAKDPGGKMPWLHEKDPDQARLMQVWFAGMHADVGGGYPDESLSYVSLLWMIEEAENNGLRTLDEITERYQVLANSYGPIHDSRSGPGGYYRYQPRRIAAWTHPVDPNTLSLRDPTVRDGNRKPKGLIGSPVVHESVIARVASGTDGYAPIVLPADYRIIPPGRLSEAADKPTSGGDRPSRPLNRRKREELLPPHVRRQLTPAVQALVAREMERAWDFVWWRRIVYFLTLIATLVLLTMPLWLESVSAWIWSNGGVLGELPVVTGGADRLKDLIDLFGAILPSLAERWIEVWGRHPFWFLGFALAVYGLMKLGARIETHIRDHARKTWHKAVPRIPPATAGAVPTAIVPQTPTALGRFRNRRGYQLAVQWFKWYILPNFVIMPLMLLLGAAVVCWLFTGDVLRTVVMGLTLLLAGALASWILLAGLLPSKFAPDRAE
jgi:uncharacterized protein (DUF2235 family)